MMKCTRGSKTISAQNQRRVTFLDRRISVCRMNGQEIKFKIPMAYCTVRGYTEGTSVVVESLYIPKGMTVGVIKEDIEIMFSLESEEQAKELYSELATKINQASEKRMNVVNKRPAKLKLV